MPDSGTDRNVLGSARTFPPVRRTAPAGRSGSGPALDAVPGLVPGSGPMPGELCAARRGTGRLRGADGTAVLQGIREYAIVVWRRQIAVGGETIHGMKRLSGKLRLKGMEGRRLLARQQTTPVVLVLEDGRHLPVVFSGSDGTFCLGRPCPDWAWALLGRSGSTA